MRKIVAIIVFFSSYLAWAQTSTVNLTSEKQYIRGFGGINVPEWAGDLTSAQRTTAYGNGAGQMGLTILRVFVNDDKNQWSKALATAKYAQSQGATIFSTPWNPPASMCETVSRNGRQEKRLKYASYGAYAQHLIDFNNYMKNNGVNLYAMSFANEPDWGFDWTWYSPDEVYNFTKSQAGKLRVNGVKVITAESFSYNKTYYNQVLNDPNALANIDIIGTHLYGSDANSPTSLYNFPLADQKAPTKERWMTEHYTNSDANSADIWPDANDVSYEIYRCMVEGQMSVYTWWYIRRQYSPMKEDGTISKRGYCMAQYTKFIRPGYKRVDATKNPTTGVYISAYKKGDDVVVVAVNRNSSSKTITISVPGTKVQKWDQYTTSGSKSLAKGNSINSSTGSFQITLDPQSTTSFVGVAPTVQVNAPVINITAPTNNTVYTEGDNVTINATATITTGSISKVDFYNGTTLLGTDASSPYSYTMNAAVAGNYTVTAKATSAANTTTTSSAISIQVAKPIFQAGSAPVIDGTVESLWNNYPSVAITHLLSGAVSSAADLSGNWKAAWDAKNLYVLVQVTDDIKRNDASTGVYNDDGVEIYVDLGNTKSTTYGANDAQYTFRWNDATAAYEINGHSVAGITRGISNTSTGYIVEVSIPWATIGGSASVNNFEGFEVMINDNDDGTRDAKMAWMATTDDTYANPSLMGTVVLKGLNCTAPTAAITAVGSTTFCAGGSVTLNASAGTGNSYVWKNGTTVIAGASTASYVAKTAGSYSVSITNSGGCSATSTGTTVTVNALPVVSLYSQVDGGTWDQITSTTVCASSTVVLGPQPNVNTGWSWSGPGNYRATTREITLTGLAANKSGNYTAMYTDGNGCKATGVYVLTVNATPVAPTVTGTTSYCQNGTASQLTATGTGLLWYTQATGGTGSAAAPTPTTTTTGTTNYYVSQTTTGCESSRAMIAVTVNALPTATITTTTPTSFCSGGSVVLTASAGSSYKWMNGTTQVGTGASYTAITSGSYTVEVTNGGNCKATSSATNVTVNAAAVAPVVTSAQTYCQNGTSSQLSATGTGLLWYTQATGGTGSAIAPTPTTTTTGTTNYYVSQTTTGCESARALITVTVTNKPTASITTTTPTSFCTGGTVVLTTSSGSSYKWMNGTTQVGTGSSYTASTSGSYTVEVTNGGNCKATSTATNVSVNAVPVAPTVTGTTYCQNDPATVLSAIGTNVKWYTQATGGTGSTTAPTPATTTSGAVNYYVSQTSTGCESSRSMIEVTVNALPVASITAESSTNIPQGGNVVLTASAGSSYKWFKGATQVGTESSYTATAPGVYSVEIMNANNCSARSAGTNVNLNSNQPSVITITSPTTSTTVEGAITITATATDPDGSIVLVEYLDGNTVIGTSTSAPYSFVWPTPSVGDHDITVRVTDSNGGITTSAPVTITSEASSTTTGLYSSNSNSLIGTLYPNPANGIVFIDSDIDLSDASFMLVDVLGNEHSISQTATGMGASIDVSNLSSGTYVLIVKKDNSVMRKKITVMK